jgi:hypothetical protein
MWLDDFSHIYVLAGTPELYQIDALNPNYLPNAYPYEKFHMVSPVIYETCSPEEIAAIPYTFRPYPDGYNACNEAEATLTFIEYSETHPFSPKSFHFQSQEEYAWAFFVEYFTFRREKHLIQYCVPAFCLLIVGVSILYIMLIFLYVQHWWKQKKSKGKGTKDIGGKGTSIIKKIREFFLCFFAISINFVIRYRKFINSNGYMQAMFNYDYNGVVDIFNNDKKKLKIGCRFYFWWLIGLAIDLTCDLYRAAMFW